MVAKEGRAAVKRTAYALAGLALVVYGTVVIVDVLRKARIFRT